MVNKFLEGDRHHTEPQTLQLNWPRDQFSDSLVNLNPSSQKITKMLHWEVKVSQLNLMELKNLCLKIYNFLEGKTNYIYFPIVVIQPVNALFCDLFNLSLKLYNN